VFTEVVLSTIAEKAEEVRMVSRHPSAQSLLIRSQVCVHDSPAKPRMNSVSAQRSSSSELVEQPSVSSFVDSSEHPSEDPSSPESEQPSAIVVGLLVGEPTSVESIESLVRVPTLIEPLESLEGLPASVELLLGESFFLSTLVLCSGA